MTAAKVSVGDHVTIAAGCGVLARTLARVTRVDAPEREAEVVFGSAHRRVFAFDELTRIEEL